MLGHEMNYQVHVIGPIGLLGPIFQVHINIYFKLTSSKNNIFKRQFETHLKYSNKLSVLITVTVTYTV